MPTLTDAEAMLRAVLENPADDVARGAYADAVEEAGDPEWAEFVRLQLQLAKRCDNGDELCRTTCAPPYFEGCPQREMMTRDWDLVHAGIRRGWFVVAGLSRFVSLDEKGRVGWHPEDVHKSPRLMSGVVRRGFVSRIELPCDAFVRDGFARELFSRHPVTEVVLSGRVPLRVGRHAYCWDARPYLPKHFDADPSRIPSAVADYIGSPEEFPSVQSALDWLSLRCVEWGRTQAGLPPLPGGAP